uniref:Uncharacterized protein n=1 Tax=Cucumis sativus TaxID=3659 RepID=A0A0A0M075_CUCSA
MYVLLDYSVTIYFLFRPTSDFPHPLAHVKHQMGYRLSYNIVDTLIWLGIRDIINSFRKKKLKLRRISYLSGHYSSLPEVPYGYIWSPHLIPKPKGDTLFCFWYS